MANKQGKQLTNKATNFTCKTYLHVKLYNFGFVPASTIHPDWKSDYGWKMQFNTSPVLGGFYYFGKINYIFYTKNDHS